MKTSLSFISSPGRLLATALLLCAVAPCTTAQRPKLTEAQVEHLIQIHAPDGLVASQIEARGITFAATKVDLASWTAEGAGPRTLAALRALILTGSIQLRTEPGGTVSLDGTSVGSANSAGLLLLQDVVPGPHQLSITKAGFHSNNQTFTLGDRETRQIFVPLVWAGGRLTISAQPTDASISITGPSSFSGPLDAARCPLGTYTIIVSQTGYVTQTRALTVAADQSYQQHFQLAVDPAYLKKVLTDAQTHLTDDDLDSAIRLSNQALTIEPSNASAYAIIAEATFRHGDLQQFVQDAGRAIQGGQSITIPLMHVHNFPRHLVHEVDMTISRSGLKFSYAPGVKCNIPESLNYDLLARPTIIRDASNTIVLHLVWPVHPQGFGSIHELDFVPLGSGMVRQQLPQGTIPIFGYPTVFQVPQNADAQYKAIIDVIIEASR